MAQRNELRCELRAANACQLSDREDIPLKALRQHGREPKGRDTTFFTRLAATSLNASAPSSTRADAVAVRCHSYVRRGSARGMLPSALE